MTIGVGTVIPDPPAGSGINLATLDGWLKCEGQEVLAADYEELAIVIGPGWKRDDLLIIPDFRPEVYWIKARSDAQPFQHLLFGLKLGDRWFVCYEDKGKYKIAGGPYDSRADQFEAFAQLRLDHPDKYR